MNHKHENNEIATHFGFDYSPNWPVCGLERHRERNPYGLGRERNKINGGRRGEERRRSAPSPEVESRERERERDGVNGMKRKVK